MNAVDPEGNREVMVSGAAEPPFCLHWLPDGRLLIVSGQGGRVLRLEPDGSLSTHADLSPIDSRHPWNEVVVDGRGNAYFNNIGFEFPDGEFAPGIVVLLTPDGNARQVADGLAFPNGMSVTPDNSTLIVAESYAGRLAAFDIAPDGSLSNQRVWAQSPSLRPTGSASTPRAPSGTAMSRTSTAGVRAGGEVLQTVELDRDCFACTLGGADGRTLFMVANRWRDPGGEERTGRILTVEAPAPGAGWPRRDGSQAR